MNTDLDDETIDVVNTLFEKMIAICPAFKQSWPTEQEFKATKKEWVIAFRQMGINNLNSIKRALDHFRLHPSPFIPSPGQFMELCKPGPCDIGAPDLESAYKEACEKSHPSYGNKKNWSHEAVKHARDKTGAYSLNSEPRSKSFQKFKVNYMRSVNDIINGKNTNQIEHKNLKSLCKFSPRELHLIFTYQRCKKNNHNIMLFVNSKKEADEAKYLYNKAGL